MDKKEKLTTEEGGNRNTNKTAQNHDTYHTKDKTRKRRREKQNIKTTKTSYNQLLWKRIGYVKQDEDKTKNGNAN